jgi:hypothetical protein
MILVADYKLCHFFSKNTAKAQFLVLTHPQPLLSTPIKDCLERRGFRTVFFTG